MKLTQILGVALVASAGVAMAGPDASAQAGVTGEKTTTSPGTSGVTQTRTFDVLDQNRDGYLTKAEAKDQISDYDGADRNSDGRIDRAEFSAFELKEPSGTHKDVDKDTDIDVETDLDADTDKGA